MEEQQPVLQGEQTPEEVAVQINCLHKVTPLGIFPMSQTPAASGSGRLPYVSPREPQHRAIHRWRSRASAAAWLLVYLLVSKWLNLSLIDSNMLYANVLFVFLFKKNLKHLKSATKRLLL